MKKYNLVKLLPVLAAALLVSCAGKGASKNTEGEHPKRSVRVETVPTGTRGSDYHFYRIGQADQVNN